MGSSIPRHLKDEDEATSDMVQCNRTIIGELSELAKQTRSDIQFGVVQAQRKQSKPTVADVRHTNWMVEQAWKYYEHELTIRRILEE